jgi:hypothetical protein
MILVQIAAALAIGGYVVLSKDVQPKRPDASPRESFQHPADQFLDCDSRAPADTQASDCLIPYKFVRSRTKSRHYGQRRLWRSDTAQCVDRIFSRKISASLMPSIIRLLSLRTTRSRIGHFFPVVALVTILLVMRGHSADPTRLIVSSEIHSASSYRF